MRRSTKQRGSGRKPATSGRTPSTSTRTLSPGAPLRLTHAVAPLILRSSSRELLRSLREVDRGSQGSSSLEALHRGYGPHHPSPHGSPEARGALSASRREDRELHRIRG